MNTSFQTYKPLVLAALGLLVLPWLLIACGLTSTSATDVVIYGIAALGLNLLVGHTGLTSFGHGAIFGIGAYAAALAQLNWFKGQLFMPIAFAVLFCTVLSWLLGALILRRRGVYFSLLTLALSALTFTIAFRWTALTGGENGLGNLTRPQMGALNLESPAVYLLLVSVLGWLVLFSQFKLLRSPFGHLLLAIRENQQRAQFQGFNVQRAKLGAFVVSGAITGFAGALMAFHHRFVSAEPTAVAFSGELLAIVVIGGMHSLLGPVLGALFYILFRELLSIWTPNWLLYFGLAFVGFVLFSPSGLIGMWQRVRSRLWPAAVTAAAMSERKTYEGLALPAFLHRNAKRAGLALEVKGLAKRFGALQAVRDATLTLDQGIHALIGPNGAGKTTAFNLISGLFAPDRGTVRLHGSEIAGLRPDAICRQGLTRSFQITNLFKGLTVFENIRLSVQARHAGAMNGWRDAEQVSEVQAETQALIRFLGLEGIEQALAGSLSYGGQRLVDMGIAIASRPAVLLLDEPLAGLAAAERDRVTALIQTVSRELPVLMVEHDIDRVLTVSSHITVMADGAVLMAGDAEAVRSNQAVQEIYTGTGVPALQAATGGKEQGATLLEFHGVSAFYGKSQILTEASLSVRKGEIVALLGRNGAGKSTLLKTLVGLVRPVGGHIKLDGKGAIHALSAPEVARSGIGYVPQGRGLFAGMTVAENLSLGRLARSQQGNTWSDEKIFECLPRIRERLNQPADLLSGGEQQMVAVARALAADVKLLLLDEPFEGLAPAVTQELFRLFDRLRSEVAIVIVEHNLDLVLALADRAYVLERGAVVHEGPTAPLLHDLDYRKKVLWL